MRLAGMRSRLVSLKTRRAEVPLLVKSAEAQKSSLWCGNSELSVYRKFVKKQSGREERIFKDERGDSEDLEIQFLSNYEKCTMKEEML
ncbi:hypothetical protein TNCV_118701 [Trichonephila clavipes]|nr:hypothetical protein TNCV_118701 [Trichonephila clavipes]